MLLFWKISILQKQLDDCHKCDLQHNPPQLEKLQHKPQQLVKLRGLCDWDQPCHAVLDTRKIVAKEAYQLWLPVQPHNKLSDEEVARGIASESKGDQKSLMRGFERGKQIKEDSLMAKAEQERVEEELENLCKTIAFLKDPGEHVNHEQIRQCELYEYALRRKHNILRGAGM